MFPHTDTHRRPHLDFDSFDTSPSLLLISDVWQEESVPTGSTSHPSPPNPWHSGFCPSCVVFSKGTNNFLVTVLPQYSSPPWFCCMQHNEPPPLSQPWLCPWLSCIRHTALPLGLHPKSSCFLSCPTLPCSHPQTLYWLNDAHHRHSIQLVFAKDIAEMHIQHWFWILKSNREDRLNNNCCLVILLSSHSVISNCLQPMNYSTPGFPVLHHLLELSQTHFHWVGDAIQPSHPLSFPSPPAPNPSQHQGLFKWVNSSCQMDKVLAFQLQYQSFQWTPRTDLL